MVYVEKIEKKATVYDIQVKNNNNFFANGILVHNCNLNSINLANIEDVDDLEKVCKTAVRLLDNAIDFTDVPIEEGAIHNKLYRTIGVGCVSSDSFVELVKSVKIDGIMYHINDIIDIDGLSIKISDIITSKVK